MPSGRRLAFTAVRLPDGSLALSAQEALPPVAAAPRPSAEAAALRLPALEAWLARAQARREPGRHRVQREQREGTLARGFAGHGLGRH